MRSSKETANSRITIFCFLDNALGRDTEIVLPVCYLLERNYNCNISFYFIWDIYEIRKKKPDMVLLPNTRGHHMYVEIAEYAVENNIKVLALESEGNFRTDGSFDFWGYNYKKVIYQEWLTTWSDRTNQYLKSILNKKKDIDKVVTTGGTGFDKYQILEKADKKSVLSNYNKSNFKKVVGYAGWAFGKIYGAHKYTTLPLIFPGDIKKRFKWVEEHRLFVRNILKEAIINNPDTLFILKRHPKESFESDVIEGKNEMNELEGYNNVLYVRKEEEIKTLIDISDIWMGFKTTTALEAWILGKPTILINDGHEYSKDNLYEGSVKVTSYNQLQDYLNEFYQSGAIADFEDVKLAANRNTIIRNTIGFSDGKNHIRAVQYFKNSIEKRTDTNKPKLNLRHLRLYILMHFGKLFYNKTVFTALPYFRKTIYVFENYGLPGFLNFKKNYYLQQEKYYNKIQLDEEL